MRVRVRYAKRGKVRFVSAIDMGRIWERALRRADLPIAYSEGFSPHPKVSFPDALTLGYASTGEYAELTFVGRFDIDRAMAVLTAALPDGMDVLAAFEVPDGAPRLSKWLSASAWDLHYAPGDGPAPASTADGGSAGTATPVPTLLGPALAGLLAADRVVVARDRKGEITEVDLRPAIVHLRVGDAAGDAPDVTTATVRAVLQATEPPMRPQELHQALAAQLAAAPHPFALPPPALVTRVAQGRASDDGVIEAISGQLIPAAPPPRQKATIS